MWTLIKEMANIQMKTGTGKSGRPINFDKDAALEAAMLLFWERGFEGPRWQTLPRLWASTVKHLCRLREQARVVLTRGEPLSRHSAQYAAEALAEPTLDKVIRALFNNTVGFLTAPGHPPSCMTLVGAVGCSIDAAQREIL